MNFVKVYENGSYLVLSDQVRFVYHVCLADGVCFSIDSAYPLDEKGLSLAHARCDHLARENLR